MKQISCHSVQFRAFTSANPTCRFIHTSSVCSAFTMNKSLNLCKFRRKISAQLHLFKTNFVDLHSRASRERGCYISESVFCLSFQGKSPIFNTTKVKQSKKRSCLSYIRSHVWTLISDKAWEWTVCFVVRRLAMPP